MSRFDSLPISKPLLEVVAELGYAEMTPIQERSIPPLLEGRDLIGQSKTGSGKTAAFSIPILQRIDLKSRTVQSLVLCPTRELCAQVAREIRKLGRRHPGLQVLVLSGGQPIVPQLSALKKGAHVVVGTPGRLLDHLDRKTLDLSGVFALVLDEADQMLDMGFEEDIKRIIEATPESRQTMLFSATYPRTILAMSRAYQRDPIQVTVEEEELAKPDIRQLLIEVEGEDQETERFTLLLNLLANENPQSAMVFCNFKATVAELDRALAGEGVSCASLHGDLQQTDRDRIMAKFRNKSTRVLVATDVAARGLDVENLDLVVNFELPSRPEIYVHRIGRTGRAGRKGLAVSFASPRQSKLVQAIEHRTGVPLERAAPPPHAPSAVAPDTASAQMLTLYIGGGRKDKVRPGDILGALTGEAGGFSADEIGKIEIHDHFSYVALSKRIAKAALVRLREGRIKGRKFRIEPVD